MTRPRRLRRSALALGVATATGSLVAASLVTAPAAAATPLLAHGSGWLVRYRSCRSP